MVSGEFSANNYTQEASNYKSGQSLFSCSKGTSLIRHMSCLLAEAKTEVFNLFYGGNPLVQEQLDAIVPIYSSFLFFLSRGAHSTVIQAVRSIHVSLQLSCRARYLPPNSCLVLCAFTFFYMLKSIKDFIFPTSGWKKWMHFDEIFR